VAPAPQAAAPEPPPPARSGGFWRRLPWWRIAPVLASAVGAVVYLILEPRPVDLAAHVFRAELFGREGFTIWNGQWYGGHHTPAYSVLSPPLAWLVGPRALLIVSALAAAALFEPVARHHFGEERARWGSIWFGAGTATLLFTSRLPFALGVVLALASVLAFQHGRRKLAVLFAVLSPLGSPVAGLFLSMAYVAYVLGLRGERLRERRVWGTLLAAAALAPPVFLSLAFPEGGYAPFPISAFVPIPLFALAAVDILPREERTLKIAAVLYALGSALALAIETPMGGNAVRLGALFGGPVLLIAMHGRWRRPVLPMVGVLAALAVWQWSPAVRDYVKQEQDPAADSEYFEPLRNYLASLPDQRRIEVPFTLSHWESAEIGNTAMLARGWLRQLDTGRHQIFYKGDLNPVTYASWLSDNAVRYVALPDVKPDKSSYRERALIESGLPYLELRWRSEHWRVFEVTLPTPIVIPQGNANITLEQFSSDRVLMRVIRPGEAIVKVRWTPYWLAHGGCVEPHDEWVKVTAPEEGLLKMTTRFSPERIFSRGKRCNDTG
jgi:hypothetical protein